MLLELTVADVGVIPELSLVLGPGMTALTGETGAGKTLVVTAIELLVGGRADGSIVRPGAPEARVEGRFVDREGQEIVLSRVVPADGRSRAYRNGRPVPVSVLAELGGGLVDLHGQHTHQSLLAPAAQRDALDRYGSVDLNDLAASRDALAAVESMLRTVGGDAAERARGAELLRHEVDELAGAALDDPDEELALEAEEDLLAAAAEHRHAAALAVAALVDEGAAGDAVATALAAVTGRAPFGEIEDRLRAAAAEINDAAGDLRRAGEAIEDDPVRLDDVRARRHLLRQLRRRHQVATLADLIAVEADARRRLDELETAERQASDLERARNEASEAVLAAAAAVGRARRSVAPALAAAVESRLRQLALPRARLEVAVGEDDPGDDIRFLLAADGGPPALPLSRTASGGELSRTMLALRLALGSTDTGTLVFDEVDAGIGGEAALAVGRALSALATETQILVVTHLPQVAAFADDQVVVAKADGCGRAAATARLLDGADRVVEVSRMLSGQPESDAAHSHAEELLSVAARQRATEAGAGGGPGKR